MFFEGKHPCFLRQSPLRTVGTGELGAAFELAMDGQAQVHISTRGGGV